MIHAFYLAIQQLPDPALRNVLLRAMAGAAGVFILLCAILWGLLLRFDVSGIEALDWLIDLVGAMAVVVVAILLYPAAVSALVGMFIDQVAVAVERRHYPRLPPPRAQGLGEAAVTSLRYAAVAILVNLLALPIYLVLLFAPPLNIFVFYGVNGYLVGREYFELAAFRRLPPVGVKELRRANRAKLFLAGGITAFLLTIPLVNLAAPIIGMAAMVHILEKLRGDPRAGSAP